MPGVGKNGRIKKTADVNRQGHRELQRNKRNNNYTGILYMYVHLKNVIWRVMDTHCTKVNVSSSVPCTSHLDCSLSLLGSSITAQPI